MLEDGYYRRKAVHRAGGYQLVADALARPVPPRYPPFWFCDHEDHQTVEEALNCPQYEQFMQQVR